MVLVAVRRYRCQRCGEITTVLPGGLCARRRYSASAIGLALCRELDRGELADALLELSKQRFRPEPNSAKTISLATLERWHYAYNSGGRDALKPAPRCERGRCQELTDEQRQLLLDIREEHRAASVPVILPRGR